MLGGMFTWSNDQKDPTLEKLDRILMSRGWESLFPIAHVHKSPRGISDHCPLVMDTSVAQGKKVRSFRFELS
jgi:exonuclease III